VSSAPRTDVVLLDKLCAEKEVVFSSLVGVTNALDPHFGPHFRGGGDHPWGNYLPRGEYGGAPPPLFLGAPPSP